MASGFIRRPERTHGDALKKEDHVITEPEIWSDRAMSHGKPRTAGSRRRQEEARKEASQSVVLLIL